MIIYGKNQAYGGHAHLGVDNPLISSNHTTLVGGHLGGLPAGSYLVSTICR